MKALQYLKEVKNFVLTSQNNEILGLHKTYFRHNYLPILFAVGGMGYFMWQAYKNLYTIQDIQDVYTGREYDYTYKDVISLSTNALASFMLLNFYVFPTFKMPKAAVLLSYALAEVSYVYSCAYNEQYQKTCVYTGDSWSLALIKIACRVPMIGTVGRALGVGEDDDW